MKTHDGQWERATYNASHVVGVLIHLVIFTNRSQGASCTKHNAVRIKMRHVSNIGSNTSAPKKKMEQKFITKPKVIINRKLLQSYI